MPFTTGTTGTEGQNEATCYASGTTGIDRDVWFEWTASVSGVVTLTTCGGTSLDSKIAVYPGSGCPVDGSSLACNDDACGLQSTLSWNASAGATYTLQIGVFPGAAGGSGTFDIVEEQPAFCIVQHDGASEATLGLPGGGEIGWMHFVKCLPCFTWIRTAYGDVPNGSVSRVVVYEDHDTTDQDPTTNVQLLEILTEVQVTVVNAGTDILNCVLLTRVNRFDTSGAGTWILATAEYEPGQQPAPIDLSFDNPHAWFVANEGPNATLDFDDLNANSTPPTRLTRGTFLLETVPDPLLTCQGPARLACFGDGSGAPCPCANESAVCDRRGCLNGLGLGALLTGSGSNSVSADTLVLTVEDVPQQPGLFFQGDNLIGGGAGVIFGDGKRCCGTNLVRLQLVIPPGPAPSTVSTSVSIATLGGVSPGDERCYQYWYRNPTASPCGANFNLSNAAIVTWGP